jgi:predicted nucleic acid-binding protein
VTSKPGESGVERVPADANVLLSAVLGHAALKVFTHFNIEAVSTGKVLEEVREYLTELAQRYGIAIEALEAQLRLLAILEISPDECKDRIPEATRKIGSRDPDDVELLALALALDIPVWSNDNDFKGVGVEWYTTARLLKKLG